MSGGMPLAISGEQTEDMTMIIDFTLELAPLLWGLVVLLLVAAGALVASVDPEIAEIYVGDRRLLAAAAVVAVIAVAALAMVHPEIARALRSP